MKITIRDKQDGQVIETVSIPYSQNPIEAILNWCDNMGYRFVEIETETKI